MGAGGGRGRALTAMSAAEAAPTAPRLRTPLSSKASFIFITRAPEIFKIAEPFKGPLACIHKGNCAYPRLKPVDCQRLWHSRHRWARHRASLAFFHRFFAASGLAPTALLLSSVGA